MLKVAVIGYGFVGAAVGSGLRQVQLIIVDPKFNYSTEQLVTDHPDLSVAFVCTPTPMGAGGEVDVSITDSVLKTLSVLPECVKVLKSTVTPDYAERFSREYDRFVYNPEFLTEANAYKDFLEPPMHVFGSYDGFALDYIRTFYEDHTRCIMTVPVYRVTAQEASFVKYAMNSFLALKVGFFNQLRDLVDQTEANYHTIRRVVGTDPRIGASHTMVPGPDGRRGFSGPCFGKDIPAFIKFGTANESELSILKEAWNSNCSTRNAYGDPLPREKEQKIRFEVIE